MSTDLPGYNNDDDESSTEATTQTPIQLEYSTLLPPHTDNHILFDFSENEVETGTEQPPLRSYGVPKTYHQPDAPPPQQPQQNSFQSLPNNLASCDFPHQAKEEPKASQFEVDLSRVNFPSQPTATILASGVQPPSVRVTEQDRNSGLGHQSFRGGLTLHDDLFPPPPPRGVVPANGGRFAKSTIQQKKYDDNIIFVKVSAPGEQKVSKIGPRMDDFGSTGAGGYQLDYYSASRQI